MRNLALFLKYDGTAYHGWQVQKNACSVAQTLEEAAADVVGHRRRGRGRQGQEWDSGREYLSQGRDA